MRLAATAIIGIICTACFNERRDTSIEDAAPRGPDGGDPAEPDAGGEPAADGAPDPAADAAPDPLTVAEVCDQLCATVIACYGGDAEECGAGCRDYHADCAGDELESLVTCASASCDQFWDCVEPYDCHVVCGDGLCEGDECTSCPGDCDGAGCGCGDGTCQPDECGDCPADCPGGCGDCSDGSAAFGADAFGYRGCLRALGPVPPCEDISLTGSPGCADDDCSSLVPLTFDFDFYGEARAAVTFSANGQLGFPASGAYQNTCTLEPDTIAVYWDDLFPPGGTGLRYQLFGTAPDRHMTFQWKVPHYTGGGEYDIRAVLREGSSDIEICYVDTVTLSAETDEGASATIGIRGPASDQIDYACDEPAAGSGLLVRFEHPGGGGGGGGGISLAPAVNYGANFNPRGLAAADLDGDGHLDLAVANQNTNLMSILRGDGDGSFQAPVPYRTGSDAYSVAAGHLDADAALDLVVANLPNGGSVSMFRSNGDGTFQAAVDLAAGTNPASVAIEDLDGDGDGDLLAANLGSDDVSVRLGDGNGTLAPPVDYPAGVSPLLLTTGDVDGDGILDLAVADIGGGVSILLGNGDGSFQDPLWAQAGTQPRSVALGDLDGDGRLDLAVANFGSDDLSVLLGNGDGSFQAATEYATGNDPHSVALGDLDRDGRLDVVVGNVNDSFANPGNPGSISVFRGRGDGSLEAAIDLATGSGSIAVVIADANSDGRADVLVANNASGDVSVLLGL